MKLSFIVALVVAIATGSAGLYFLRQPTTVLSTNVVAPSDAADAIPSAGYLFEHPTELKNGESRCTSTEPPSALFCSNVHKAESLRMADQYNRAAQPKGAAQ